MDLAEGEGGELRSLEQEVFRALDHQMRRDILRFIGEGRGVAFTEIMNTTNTPDSPTLSYHLKILAPFLEQHDGKYALNSMGRDAFNLLLRTTTYNRLALFRSRRREVTLANAVVWVCAIAAAMYMRADAFLSMVLLPICAGVGLFTIHELFE